MQRCLYGELPGVFDLTYPLPLWLAAIDSSGGETQSGLAQTADEAIRARAASKSSAYGRAGRAGTSTT